MRKEDYFTTIVVDGKVVPIGIDDYGQCYYFEYVDKDGQLQEMTCGTYNFNWEKEISDFFKCIK